MWQGANGLSAYDGIVSPAYTVVTPLRGQIPEFWAFYFKLPETVDQFRKYSQGLTKDTWNLKFPIFGEIKVMVPHPDEQRKIAATLSALDAKIDALSLKINEMETFKKGLLQKLFV
jgi:type I restriction enzyme S subunit